MNLLSECCCSTEASNSVPRIYTCGWLSQQCSGPKSPRSVHSVRWCGVGCVMEVIFVICGTRRIIWDNEQIGRHTSYSEHPYNVSCGGRPPLFRKSWNKYSKLKNSLLIPEKLWRRGNGYGYAKYAIMPSWSLANAIVIFFCVSDWLPRILLRLMVSIRHKMPWYKW